MPRLARVGIGYDVIKLVNVGNLVQGRVIELGVVTNEDDLAGPV